MYFKQTKSFGFFRFVALGAIFTAFVFGVTTQNAFAAGWTQQSGAGSRDWRDIASSSDGTTLFAVAGLASGLWISTDGGVNWTDKSTVTITGAASTALSADGSMIFIGSFGNSVYISTDNGDNWTESVVPIYSGDIASSVDGMNVIVGHAGSNGSLYTSTDGGANWTERTGAGSGNWYRVASSSDGTILAAANYGGYIYTSTDSGATWTERTSLGTGNWYSLTMSSDGTKLVTAQFTGGSYIYTSTDGGANWTEQTASGNRAWVHISASADGSIIVAPSYGGYVYLSTDSGATWTEQTEAGTGGGGWNTSTTSADGTKLAVAGAVGSIYTGEILTVPTVTTGSASSITSTTATLGGNITDVGGADPTIRGIHYGTTTGYGSTNSATGTFSTGSFTRDITGLTCNTFYHYRAFATNTGGTATGSDGTFTTSACVSKPTVTTGSASSITQTSAVLPGSITATGGENATTRGVYYLLAADLSPSPHNISSTTPENGSYGVGDFSGTATGLTCGTDYAFAPYAENGAGSQTGDIGYFSTSACGGGDPEPQSESHSQVIGGYVHINKTPQVENILESGTCSADLIIHDFMKKGDRNGKYSTYNKSIIKEVALLQAHINRILAAQYKQAAGPVDGIFGRLTMQGVQRLQTALNETLQPVPKLKIDGIVGKYTRAAINNSCGGM